MDYIAIIILVGIILFLIIITIVIYRATNIFKGKGIGADCVNDTECGGWLGRSAMCCNGKCTNAVLDWARIGQCPDTCQDAPSPLGIPGSCKNGYTWPRSKGQPCDTHVACAGWVAGKPGRLACCNGTCQEMLEDWAGIGYCPHECKDSPTAKQGSCGSGLSYPRKENQPCDTHAACEGWVAGKIGTLACCQGKCQKQIKDWAGVGYCPHECRDAPAPLGKPGTCSSGLSYPRKENQPCDTHLACSGWVAGKVGSLACCQGKCQKQLKDWAGIGYCPHECVGEFGGKSGTCK